MSKLPATLKTNSAGARTRTSCISRRSAFALEFIQDRLLIAESLFFMERLQSLMMALSVERPGNLHDQCQARTWLSRLRGRMAERNYCVFRPSRSADFSRR